MNKNGEKQCSNFLPARYIVVFFVFMVCMEMYAHRVVLNVAIVAMVNNTAIENQENRTVVNECPDEASKENITFNYREGKYEWSQPDQGIILGSFYYTYAIFQFLGGPIVNFLGAKRTYIATVMLSSLLLLITPFVAELGVAAIACQRIFLGAMHGLAYPSGFSILGRWSPVPERSTLMAICVGGNHIGSIIGMPLTGYLCEYGFAGGWPSCFYVVGAWGCFLAFCLIFVVYDQPNEYPRISEKELQYIQKDSNSTHTSNKKQNIPWKKILTSGPVWATCILKLCFAWGFYTFLSKLPSYLDVVLHFPIQQNGLINAGIYLAQVSGLIFSGYLSDLLIKRQCLSVTNVRKMFETLAVLGTTSCMLSIPLAGCNNGMVIAVLITGSAFMGLVGGGDNSIILNIAPAYTGALFGLTNGMASVPGFLSPYIAGLLLHKNQGSMVQWSYVFYLASGSCLLGMVIFLIFGSAELQPWNNDQANSEKSEKKNNDLNNEIPTKKDESLIITTKVIT